MCLTNTRLDTCFVVNDLSQFLTDPRHAHLVAKHAVRYLKGIVDYGLKYEANQKINLEGYVDSYWAGSAIDKKSTSGCCFSMRSSVISWFGRMESCMVLSTAKEKYVANCYLGERSSEAPVCDPDRDLLKDGVLAYPMRRVV